MKILRQPPQSQTEFKKNIYSGNIYILDADAHTQKLTDDLRAILRQHFTVSSNLENIHNDLDDQAIWHSLNAARADVVKETFSRNAITPIISPLFNRSAIFDVLRLRCATHEGYLNPAAANSVTAHRDTWFANPEAQINIWIPIFNVSKAQSFQFFPSYFDKPIDNNSSEFDYGEWSKNIGFQSTKKNASAVYPTAQTSINDSQAFSFACNAGDMVIFSASHLHQTCMNNSGLTRFSVDFRVVDLDDVKQGRGAPKIDNESQGNASAEYLRLSR